MWVVIVENDNGGAPSEYLEDNWYNDFVDAEVRAAEIIRLGYIGHTVVRVLVAREFCA